jgi:hypothetical protein
MMVLTNVLKKFRREPDIYITMLVISIVLLLDILGVVAAEAVSAGILAVLALLTFSLLQLRQKLDRADQGNDQITQQLAQMTEQMSYLTSGATEIEQVTESHQRIEMYRLYVSTAQQEVFLLGTPMRNTSTDLSMVQAALQAGKVIRLLFLDPVYLAQSPEVAHKIDEILGLTDVQDEAEKSLRRFIQFGQSNRLNPKQFQIRVYAAVPTVGLVVADPQQLNSRMFFEIFPYKCEVYRRPRFFVRPYAAQGNDLYDRLLAQAEALWQDARVIEWSYDA